MFHQKRVTTHGKSLAANFNKGLKLPSLQCNAPETVKKEAPFRLSTRRQQLPVAEAQQPPSVSACAAAEVHNQRCLVARNQRCLVVPNNEALSSSCLWQRCNGLLQCLHALWQRYITSGVLHHLSVFQQQHGHQLRQLWAVVLALRPPSHKPDVSWHDRCEVETFGVCLNMRCHVLTGCR